MIKRTKRVLLVLFTLLFCTSVIISLPDAGAQGNISLYLPLASVNKTYVINGQVTDLANNPVDGVSITTGSGKTAYTDINGRYHLGGLPPGEYDLAAERQGYRFQPSVVTLPITDQNQTLNFEALASCSDKIANGGMESNTAWDWVASNLPPVYTTEQVYDGLHSLRTGIVDPLGNEYGHSKFSQLVNLPPQADSVTLSAFIYPTIRPKINAPILSGDQPQAPHMENSADDYDVQYILVSDKDDNLLRTLLWTRIDLSSWKYLQFNLTDLGGQSIKIEFGVFNDGSNTVTGMYVDNVSLVWCPASQPQPDTQLEPQLTCDNAVDNSGFEYIGEWHVPDTEFPAGYSSASYSGQHSMRTGITQSAQNRFSYSDAWQTVFIPANATSAKLKMWLYPSSTAATTNAPVQSPQAGQSWPDTDLAQDAQYVLILDPSTYHIIETLLWWQPKNSIRWEYLEVNLLKYKGKSIRIQFGTFNNGVDGITAMWVDDVRLDYCTGTPPPPPPPVCSERVTNGGFERVSAWTIPVTNYSAGYSSYRYHAGAHSMRTGIVYLSHNRYSYSDARQLVSIPAWAKSANLKLWVYPMSGEGSAGHDIQYVLLLDRWGHWIDTLLWQRQNTQTWNVKNFDLSDYAGATIYLQFGTYNNGAGGVTALYVDDVSLVACP